jgi:hypothetical protein
MRSAKSGGGVAKACRDGRRNAPGFVSIFSPHERLILALLDHRRGAADMQAMSKTAILATLLALALGVTGTAALAQGVAPGGSIGNSTGIGSGLGGLGGTGPHYPNGTSQPTLPTPPPPGGYGYGAPLRPPTISTVRPPSYPQPQEPFGPAVSSASPTPLRLPEAPTDDLSFLQGCWHTDVFGYSHQGVSTYCFDAKGVGRFLYRRLDQPSYSCQASTKASYVGQQLRLHNSGTTCSDGNNTFPANLDCSRSGDEAAKCSGIMANTSGGSDAWTVRLHRTR